jgi:hypothetical protein
MPKWTKKAAIDRMKSNTLLQEVLRREPRIQAIVDEAVQQQNEAGYHRIQTYYALKHQAEPLVGWGAAKPEIKTPAHYDAVIRTLDDLLPPDTVDLNN